MTSRVVRSWMEAFGTEVLVRALDITVEIAMKDSVDSLPPIKMISKLLVLCAANSLTFQNGGIAGLYRQ